MQTRLCPIDLEQGFPLLRGWHGILCQTPEELFDLLLTDYQDFELLRRTKGRREVTEADEKAMEELCQPYLDWRKGALK